jgi:hypothetical protein
MTPLAVLISLRLLAAPAPPPPDACETRCNHEASECLKTCAGDPKEASRPDHAQKMVACLNECQARAKPCREACHKK